MIMLVVIHSYNFVEWISIIIGFAIKYNISGHGDQLRIR